MPRTPPTVQIGATVMRIERVNLPGIGAGYTLRLHQGQLLGVICHRNGHRELLFSTSGDPDTAQRSLTLTEAEAQEVAGLLHTSATIDHVTELEDRVQGITIASRRSPPDHRSMAARWTTYLHKPVAGLPLSP